MDLTRRHLLATAGAGLAAACTDVRIGDVYQAAFNLVRGFPDVPLTREQVARLPYASMRAKIGRGPRSLLILARYAGSDLHWVSADRTLFATRRGRLVKTAGIPANLKDTRFIGADPVARGLHRLEGPVDARRIIDIDRGHAFNIPVTAWLEPIRHERIEILGLTFDTVVVRERNVAELLDWRFENTFWADRATGFIWKSVQHIVDLFAPLEFEILKPAA